MKRTKQLLGMASLVAAAALTTGSAWADSTVSGILKGVESRGSNGTVKISNGLTVATIAWGSCNPVFTAVDIQTLATAAQNGTTVTLSYTLVGSPVGVYCLTAYEIKP